MKKNVELILALVVLILFGILIYVTATSNKEEGLKEVKVGVLKGGSVDSIIDYGTEKDFFKKRGLKITKIEADQNIVALLNSGEVDIIVNRMASSIVPFLNNEDHVLLAIIQQYPSDAYGISRYPLGEIKSIKKVGVTRMGGAHHLSMIPILENFEINPKSVEFVATGGGGKPRLAMLERGQIDFAIANQSEITGSTDGFHIISPSDLHGDVFVPNGAVSTRGILNNKSAEIELFLEALYKVTAYAEQNKDDYSEFLFSRGELTKDEARQSVENLIKSRKNISFIPKKEDLEKLRDVVVDIAEPKNPKRDLGEFIFADYAQRIER